MEIVLYKSDRPFTLAIHTDKHTQDKDTLLNEVGLLPALFMDSMGTTLLERGTFGYARTAGVSPKWQANSKAKIVNMRYTYPEDPDLQPLVSIYLDDTEELVHLYAYGLVAVYDGSRWLTARMD